mmetsp:Transcript_11482/g.27073  ORF Transcript_11482/g.27073 Transcript_11482/m.27073 type:complete len:225 (+) Transcript_11482:100-774(+)
MAPRSVTSHSADGHPTKSGLGDSRRFFLVKHPVPHHTGLIILHMNRSQGRSLIHHLLGRERSSVRIRGHRSSTSSLVLGARWYGGSGDSNLGSGGRSSQRILTHLRQTSLIGHERQNESLRLEGTDDVVDERGVRADLLVGLEAGIGGSALGGDVHGAVGTEQNGIHAVSAGLKGAGIDDGAGAQSVDARRLGLGDGDALHGLVLGFVGPDLLLVGIVVEDLGD